MKKKKNRFLGILIVIIIMLILSLSTIYFDLKYFQENFNNDEIQDELEDNSSSNNINNITESYVEEYLGTFNILFLGSTSDGFTNDQITIFTAYEFLLNHERNIIEVQQFVNDHFDQDNFDLKAGTYNFNGDTFDINFDNNIYTTNLVAHGGPSYISRFVSMEVNGTNIVVNYTYDHVVSLAPQAFENIGTTKVYLQYKKGKLIILKTIYTSK